MSLFVESMYSDGREKAVSGVFNFVAIGDGKKPMSVLRDDFSATAAGVAPA